MGLTRSVAPAAEPLTLADAKKHLRISASDTDQDILVKGHIEAARDVVEVETGRALVEQTWVLKLDRFPSSGDHGAVATGGVIRLPRSPLISVSSVQYVDTNGTTQTFSSGDYVVQADTLPPQISLAYGESWPSTREQPNAVTVTFLAGYGDPSDVPWGIKAAMLLMLGDVYERREATITGTIVAENPAVGRLLGPYRLIEAA